MFEQLEEKQKKANGKNQHAHQEAVTTTPVQIGTKAINQEKEGSK